MFDFCFFSQPLFRMRIGSRSNQEEEEREKGTRRLLSFPPVGPLIHSLFSPSSQLTASSILYLFFFFCPVRWFILDRLADVLFNPRALLFLSPSQVEEKKKKKKKWKHHLCIRMMLPPSIDRSDFGAQRLRELEEQQMNLHFLCEAALREDDDEDGGEVHLPSPPMPRSRQPSTPKQTTRKYSPPAGDHPNRDLLTGEVESFSSSVSDEFFRKRAITPSPRNGMYGDGTVATPSPFHDESAPRQPSNTSHTATTSTRLHVDGTINEMGRTVDGTSRNSPSLRRSHQRPPPPPPPPLDDSDSSDGGAAEAPRYSGTAPPAPAGFNSTFQEAYRKYCVGEPLKIGAARHVSALSSLNHNTLETPRSCSALSATRSSVRQTVEAAYKKYLTPPSLDTSSVRPCAPRLSSDLDSQPKRAYNAAAAPPPPSVPSVTVPYQPSSRSASEQSDLSTYSKTAATIAKWRKVLYAGAGSHPQDTSETGLQSQWELPPGEPTQQLQPPLSPTDSRSISSVSAVVDGRRYTTAKGLMEREERKIRKYFNHNSARKEEEEWNLSNALSHVEHRRQHRLDPPLPSPASSRGSISPIHPYSDGGAPDGLVDDYTRPSQRGVPPLVDGDSEFFDADPVRSLLLHPRHSGGIPPPSPSSQASSQLYPCAGETTGELVSRENEEALQLEVQKTREKAEALARHLVKALEEKRKLQEDLAQMELQMSGGSGHLVVTEVDDPPATAGVQAALRTKERELTIYEEEIERLNGLVKQQQQQLQHHAAPTVVLAAQAAAAAEVDAAINEVGVAHLSQRRAEERAEKLATELESAVNVIYTLDGRVAELQKAAMAQQVAEMRASAFASASVDRDQQNNVGPVREGAEKEALVELIRRAEGLLHQSDAASRYTAKHLASLQRTCQELRRQLQEKGGEVEELQDQCNALRRDKNVLRLYGAQWLQQLQDVQADAEVIADIVRTSKKDAESIVIGSLTADSLLATSLSTLEDVTPIRDHASSSRHFAELVMRDMHAVARYLAALRRMNIGDREGYAMLERLASGRQLLLGDEDDDDEPTLLAAPAREVIQQKRQFVLDAVEEALRAQREENALREHRGEGTHSGAAQLQLQLDTETEAEELIVSNPPSVRESSPLPVHESVARAAPFPHTSSTSDTHSRERSTTARPDAVSHMRRPMASLEQDEGRLGCHRSPSRSAAQPKGASTPSKRRHRDDDDEPTLPFFGAGPGARSSAAPTPVNATLPPEEAPAPTAAGPRGGSEAVPSPPQTPSAVIVSVTSPSTSAALPTAALPTDEQPRASPFSTPSRSDLPATRAGPGGSVGPSASSAGLPQLQRSSTLTPSRIEGSTPPSPSMRRTPLKSNAGMMATAQPLEPQHRSEPAPMRSSSGGAPQRPLSPVPATQPAMTPSRDDLSPPAPESVDSTPIARLSGASLATATPVSGSAITAVAPPSTGVAPSAQSETLTQQPASVPDVVAPGPATPTSMPATLRRRLDEPAKPAVTTLPEPACGNPFGEMSQPAEPPSAPGMAHKPDDLGHRRGGSARPASEAPTAPSQLPAPAPAAAAPVAVSNTIPLTSATPVGAASPPPPALSPPDTGAAAESLRLPPRPFTKPVQQQRVALKPRAVLREGNAADGQLTPANVSTDSAAAEALTLSPIVGQQNRSASALSINSMHQGDGSSLDSSIAAGAVHPTGGDAKRKEDVAKILERLRAAKKN
eukprot:gene11955-8230_t